MNPCGLNICALLFSARFAAFDYLHGTVTRTDNLELLTQSRQFQTVTALDKSILEECWEAETNF